MKNEPLTVLTPVGGLNGDINQMLISVAHQTYRPEYVVLLVDSDLADLDIQRSTVAILRRMGIRLTVAYDEHTTSIAKMRRDLIAMSPTQWSVFVDSDAILMPDALEQLIHARNIGTMTLYKGAEIMFVEGARIEVGGRKDEANFSIMEKKQVGEDDSTINEIMCGDTCLLLFRTAPFETLPWDTLLAFYDKRGLGGSDFAMTVAVLAKGGATAVGVSAPNAVCWHTASLYRGYWKNYATADHMLETVVGPSLDKLFNSTAASNRIHAVLHPNKED